MLKILFLAGCLFLAGWQKLSAQQVVLRVQTVFAGVPVDLSEDVFRSGDSLEIEVLRFYLSGFRAYYKNHPLEIGAPAAKLVDASVKGSGEIILHLPAGKKADRISFYAGIDSLTNVSGALGGDLDPTLGMYWTWQSGYINFKAEGKVKRAGLPQHDFELHLGGYMSPWQTVQEVSFPLGGKKEILIQLDLQRFFATIDWKEEHHIMSPGETAWRLSEYLAQCLERAAP